jgi:hypothetical protein
MMHSELEPAYETARWWAVQPVSHPPPGWAHIVRHGLATWLQERRPATRQAAPQETALKRSERSGLLTLVAAMIAEVCPC